MKRLLLVLALAIGCQTFLQANHDSKNGKSCHTKCCKKRTNRRAKRHSRKCEHCNNTGCSLCCKTKN